MTASDADHQFATQVVNRLKQAGFQALWAGGCVRDYLLGRTPKDYDVATDARPEQVRELFGHRRTLAVGASFGVIVVRGPRGVNDVEVATFRTEGPYLDGRRPESVAFATPEEDAKRRDFTINGMFFDPVDKQVLDFVGGEHDLGVGVIRAIGDPHDRVTEDKLRMLRAVRFATTLDFELDETTADAIREMASQMIVVSAERIAQELKRMLVHEHRARGLKLLRDVNLLPVIFPELTAQAESVVDIERTLRMLHLLDAPTFELVMSVIWREVPHEQNWNETLGHLTERLRLSNRESEHIAWLLGHQDALNNAPALPLCELKPILAHEYATDILKLVRVSRMSADCDLSPVVFCDEYLRSTPREVLDPPVLVTGGDLIALGLEPSPKFKDILQTIRDRQLDEEILTRDEALQLANELVAHSD